MTTKRLGFSLVFSAFLLALLCPALPGQNKELFPLRLGSKWTYQSGEKKEVVVLRLKGFENVGDTPCAVLETKREDGVVLSEYVALPAGQADGLYRLRLGVGKLSLPLEPPICFLKLPAVKTKWQIESRLGGQGGGLIQGTATQDQEEVSVPLGKFKAVRVRIELKRGDQVVTITSYFAPGAGMVKQVQTLGEKQTVLELQKFEEGK